MVDTRAKFIFLYDASKLDANALRELSRYVALKLEVYNLLINEYS